MVRFGWSAALTLMIQMPIRYLYIVARMSQGRSKKPIVQTKLLLVVEVLSGLGVEES